MVGPTPLTVWAQGPPRTPCVASPCTTTMVWRTQAGNPCVSRCTCRRLTTHLAVVRGCVHASLLRGPPFPTLPPTGLRRSSCALPQLHPTHPPSIPASSWVDLYGRPLADVTAMAMGDLGLMPTTDAEIAFLSVIRTKWQGANLDYRGQPSPKLD